MEYKFSHDQGGHIRESVVQDQKTSFARPDNGNLHLLHDDDDFTAILPTRSFMGSQFVYGKVRREKIRMRSGFDVCHYYENGV